MFANSLLKQRVIYQQESQNQESFCVENCQENLDQNGQIDFTFDNYLPKAQGQNDDYVQNVQKDLQTKYSNYLIDVKQNIIDNPIQNGQKFTSQIAQQRLSGQIQQESQQLSILKQHILNIQSIAMKQIEDLKVKLQKAQNQKQQMKGQIQKLKQFQHINKQLQQSSEQFQQNNGDQQRQSQPNLKDYKDCINLLKQENKMLKESLKKQIQMNKHLIKQSIKGNIYGEKTQYTENANIQPQNQKQNSPFQANRIKSDDQMIKMRRQIQIQTFRFNLNDKPAIPLPSNCKKQPLRG